MVQKILNYREMIYGLQKALVVLVCDPIIFDTMLALRRKHVESFLELHGVPFVPWTLQILEEHYNPRNNHRFDAARILERERRAMCDLGDALMDDGALYVADPSTGERVFHVKVGTLRVAVSKQIKDLTVAVENMNKANAAAATIDIERVLAAVAHSAGDVGKKGAKAASVPGDTAAADAQLGAVYDIGGLA